jgi:asparagine synthase (glutamine-hydrolysing)
MCGITGFMRRKKECKDPAGLINDMTMRLTHRGPDDSGVFMDDDIALGHRRLSIIDLNNGRQPIKNEDGSIIVILNGEIYNYTELSLDLKEKGHSFNTKSDTETIVHLYEEKGADCVKLLNGIFAFALWDKRKRKLLLARDRLGVKPLHYMDLNGHFVFGSEIKSILEYPYFDRQIDTASLAKYLVYEFVPAPNSIFKGIKKLPPAHILELDAESGRINMTQYWNPDFIDKFSGISEEDASSELLRIMRRVVRRELISDVPLGLFLSGGIDSSALAVLMSETGQVNAFCVGFDEPSFDESSYARRVAKHLGIKYNEKIFTSADVCGNIETVADFLDEPMADPSILPTYLLSKFARRNITVAFGGDGGDELFVGYDTYQAHRIADYYRAMPRFLKSCASHIIDRLPVSTSNMSLDFKLNKFMDGINCDPAIRNAVWLGAFKDTDISGVISGDIKPDRSAIFEDIEALYPEIERIKDPIEQIQYLDLRFYLQDDILVKVDRASMANSLEVRVPFLNHELVDFVTRLPPNMKLQGLKTKFILKKALKDKIPADILARNKKGFGIPVAEWIKKDLKELIMDHLNPGKINREGFFKSSFITALLNEHFKGTKNNRKKIWTILIFELWLERYMNTTGTMNANQ